MRTEIFKDRAGEWRFRFIAENNEQVADSEGYHNFRDALATAHKLQPDAPVKIIAETDDA